MTFIPKPQEVYKHFKGNMYQVVTVAQHCDTGEQMVIYQAMYGDYQVYARELSSFNELLDKAKYPEATQKFRFELQGPNSFRQVSANVSNLAESNRASAEYSEEEALSLDPLLLEFLDADSYTKRLQMCITSPYYG